MPWPVYSVRFLKFSGDLLIHTYTVPAGQRAVIRSVSAVNSSSVAGELFLRIAGTLAWYGALPARSTVTVSELHQVVYAGEGIEGSVTVAATGLIVSGFLLSSAGASDDPPADETRERRPIVESLPNSARWI